MWRRFYISSILVLFFGREVFAAVSLEKACGPVSCWAALRLLGIDESFPRICEGAGWEPGKRISFFELKKALDATRKVECVAVSCSSDELVTWLKDGWVAVALVRSSEDDYSHVVCVSIKVGVERPILDIIDYPLVDVELSPDDFSKLWGSKAILIRPQTGGVAVQLYISFVLYSVLAVIFFKRKIPHGIMFPRKQ